VAAKLVPIVRALEDDFFSTSAGAVAADLGDMHELAFDDFKRKRWRATEDTKHTDVASAPA